MTKRRRTGGKREVIDMEYLKKSGKVAYLDQVLEKEPPKQDLRTPFQMFLDKGVANGPGDWKERVTSNDFHCSVLAGCVLASMPGDDGITIAYDCATVRLADWNGKLPYQQVQMIVSHPSQLNSEGRFK